MAKPSLGLNAAGEKVDAVRGELLRYWPEDLLPMSNYRFGSTDSDPEVIAAREEEIEDMVSSLCLQGQLQPILIRPVSGDRVQVVAGDTRHRAALRINERNLWPWSKPEDGGRMRLDCKVEAGSERESFGNSLVENLQRKNLSPIDIANAVQIASQKYQYTDQEIRARFKQTTDPAWLSNMRSLAKLPDSIKRKIHLRDFAPSVGYLLSEIPEAEHEAVLSDAAASVAVEEPPVEAEEAIFNPFAQPSHPSESVVIPERTIDYGESQIPRAGHTTTTIGKTGKRGRKRKHEPKPPIPKAKAPKVTARAVAKAAKARGLLKHKKVANTVSGMRGFWIPIATQATDSLVKRLAMARHRMVGRQ